MSEKTFIVSVRWVVTEGQEIEVRALDRLEAKERAAAIVKGWGEKWKEKPRDIEAYGCEEIEDD